LATAATRTVPLAEPSARPSLLERERELRTLREIVAGATEGRPGLVAIEGPAGIGKTRLLGKGRRLAEDAGARVLTARGGELEQELAFGVVRQLFEQELIAPDTPVLRGAAGAAREVFDATAKAAGDGTQDDASFAILRALYWLTVNFARDAPLVIAVDDLHWCDVPSLRYLGYVVRRLEGLSVTLMCTLRPLERRARAALLGEVVDDPLAVSLYPGPLSVEATRRLVSERLFGDAHESFSTACHTATGGNPLLLGELLTMLHAEGVRPDAGRVSAVADLGPRALSRAVLVRLARLPADAVMLACAAAVLGDEAELPLVAEAAGLTQGAAAAAANALVAAEILSDQARITFLHPLIGAAIYEDIPAHERSLAHERAARLLRERGHTAGAVAVHLAKAPARGEEWVCDTLETAAHASLRAGSPASAVGYLTRALAEPPPARRHAQVLLDLGRTEVLTNGPAAVEHLTEALALTDDARARGSIALALAHALMFTGRAGESVELVLRTKAELGTDSDDLARALEAVELMVPLFGAGDTASLEQLERHRELPRGAGAGAKMLAAAVARHWAYAGGPAEACAQLALEALDGGELIAADNVFFSVTAILVLELADRAEASEGWDALLQDARVRGSLPSKAAISLWRGYSLYRHGELADAETSLRGALEELTLWNAGAEGGVHHAAFLSAVLRERGDLAGARRSLQAVEDPGDASDAARYWLDGLTELLIAEERFEEALAVAHDSEWRFEFLVHPVDTPARCHRALALYHLGRREEAVGLAAEAVELARLWGAPAPLGRALRTLGTLERDAGLEHLHEAVEIAGRSPARLEHAKALAALGHGLRAARRPTEARDPLRRAVDLADRLGAGGLLEHARHELHAAGGRPRTKALTGAGALTPSERRVTERAAAGQSNRAIAEALFVTPKTVERHLGNAYRKLGVSSRHELADKLAAPDGPADRAPTR
jgi:DNA-binding CsgD family transcriptional regulator